MSPVLFAAACALDWIVGDPEWFPHPVRFIGAAIRFGETWLWRKGLSHRALFLRGALLTLCVVAGSYSVAFYLVALFSRINGIAGNVVTVLVCATCLASRNLLDEGRAVYAQLSKRNLPQARVRVSRIVGRDTDHLDESEVSRATIETLAESLCDGVIAPVFWMVVGGPAMAMAFKAVNTLDSMIGHHEEKYEWFGKCAARLDDAANYLPARISALLIMIVVLFMPGLRSSRAWKIWRRDASHHASPNAGHSEAAMAGALGVQLGGMNLYGGEMVHVPIMGGELPHAVSTDVRRALWIVALAALLGMLVSEFVLLALP